MSLKIYHNPRCRKSREALQHLEETNQSFDIIHYMDNSLSKSLIEQLLKEAEAYVKSGLSFLKIKIGKNPNFDAQLIDAFRQNFPNIDLAADSNHAYNFKEALTIGRLLEKHNYTWFTFLHS